MMTDKGESNVNIEAMLSYTDDTVAATEAHNWHVHQTSVSFGNCATAGLHYNPFEIDISDSVSQTAVTAVYFPIYGK